MNSTVTLPVVQHSKHYDIVVVGGGTAGAVAAIAAAESGKDVLIVERGYALGGSATLAQVTPLMGTRIGKYRNSYIGIRLQNMLEERGYTAAPWAGCDKTLFSPVTLTVVLEEMCVNAGVELLYGASYVNSVTENGRIQAVLVQTLEGLVRIDTSFVIDATGDAQVAFTCGCPFEAGDPENNNENQNMSLRFAVGNIDFKRVNKFLKEECGEDADPESEQTYMAHEWKSTSAPLYNLFCKGLENGDIERADGVYFQSFTSKAFGRGVMYFNCPEAPRCRNTTDSIAVSQGVADCRASAVRVHRFLQKYVPGFEDSTIISFAQLAGVRESRRIVGEYWLTIEDYNARAKFPDAIAQSAYPIDVHGKAVLVHPNDFAPGEFFEIPYGCLVAKGVDNLLVAGRCSSASFWAQSAIRIQLVCHAFGEAAGIAAAMALDLNCAAAKVDGASVRAEMIARGGTFAPVD
ncbi:MAG: FAD-dependent oxidoreductase [Ruminococcaceae bacterium]|nr:FAD-dependent oxidoreductase [Oscillospiraceae bacterium]